MFFVVDKPKLQRIIALIRDGRTAASRSQCGHYMRLEDKIDRVVYCLYGIAEEEMLSHTDSRRRRKSLVERNRQV